MKFNNDRTSVQLSFEETKMLEWSDILFEELDESIEELKEEKPSFKFFKNYEAEIVYGPDNSVNIGEQGVEGKEWESFLEELEDLKRERVEELTENTLLAEREAEAYILTEELDYTIQEAADEMDVGFGRVSGARNRIKEKIMKSEKTAELSI